MNVVITRSQLKIGSNGIRIYKMKISQTWTLMSLFLFQCHPRNTYIHIEPSVCSSFCIYNRSNNGMTDWTNEWTLCIVLCCHRTHHLLVFFLFAIFCLPTLVPTNWNIRWKITVLGFIFQRIFSSLTFCYLIFCFIFYFGLITFVLT